ncbi:hypothetical protein [Streptomyces soliscabiei]|uniref:hypothetical protein n=1 Tax=Streptomyces soliscabiei TaxID=588897 RepID=UPI0029AA5E0D|nr:hypothetical protein [Streptomyces sp. NY05-11A]MDX2680557.1 hypothetical protein [Streptomyces sp. NY05-11A]
MTAATLLTTNSGPATSLQISSAPVARSMARTRGLTASYRPPALTAQCLDLDAVRDGLEVVHRRSPLRLVVVLTGTTSQPVGM